MSISPISGNVHFDHWVRVVSGRCLHCKVTFISDFNVFTL